LRRLTAEFVGTFLLVFAGAEIVNEVSSEGVGSLGV
jgi:glycerol uptake facilitator-like aquaporin